MSFQALLIHSPSRVSDGHLMFPASVTGQFSNSSHSQNRRHDQCSNGLSAATSRNCNRKAMPPGMITRSQLIYKILLSLLCDTSKHLRLTFLFSVNELALCHTILLVIHPFSLHSNVFPLKKFFFTSQFPPISLTWKHHIYSQFPHINKTGVSSILAIYPKWLT